MVMAQEVNANGEDHMRFYETGRLYPFRDAKPGYHSNADVRDAYDAWANAVPGRRLNQWEFYCDVRDGFAIGTNAAIREKYEKQQLGYIEARQSRLK